MIKRIALKEVIKHPEIIRKTIAAHLEGIENRYKILKQHNFSLENHYRLNNKYNAHNSKGCGCILCVARYEFVLSKVAIKRLKHGYMGYNPLLFENFQKLYCKYVENNQVITETEFYKMQLKELKQRSKDLHLKYLAAKDTVDHILSI
jgi:hypothetical protein